MYTTKTAVPIIRHSTVRFPLGTEARQKKKVKKAKKAPAKEAGA